MLASGATRFARQLYNPTPTRQRINPSASSQRDGMRLFVEREYNITALVAGGLPLPSETLRLGDQREFFRSVTIDNGSNCWVGILIDRDPSLVGTGAAFLVAPGTVKSMPITARALGVYVSQTASSTYLSSAGGIYLYATNEVLSASAGTSVAPSGDALFQRQPPNTKAGSYDAMILQEANIQSFIPLREQTNPTDLVGATAPALHGAVALGGAALITDNETSARWPNSNIGFTDYIDAGALRNGAVPWTWELWATADSYTGPNDRALWTYNQLTGNQCQSFGISSTGYPRLVVPPETGYLGPSPLSPGPHHFVFTTDGTGVGTGNALWVDGVKVIQVGGIVSAGAPADREVLGYRPHGTSSQDNPFGFGNISKWARYSYVLPSARILAHYNGR